eukprot:7296967-Alexandrium_andersonii.AAC.1
MSASLVGSEMCIRDSGGAIRAEQGGHLKPTKPLGQEGLETTWHQKGGPVSYTHLTLPTICSV